MIEHFDELILMRFYHLVVFIAVHIAAVFVKRIFDSSFARAGKITHRYLFHSLRFIEAKICNVHLIIRFFCFSLNVKIVGIIQVHFHFFDDFSPRIERFLAVCSVQPNTWDKSEYKNKQKCGKNMFIFLYAVHKPLD